MPQDFIKDPDSLLDYKVDWSDWLGTDTLVSSSWAIEGPDSSLTVSTSSNTTTDATAWLDGGVVPNTYTVTNSIITDQGREADRSITITVMQR